jgi:hypothetical protein
MGSVSVHAFPRLSPLLLWIIAETIPVADAQGDEKCGRYLLKGISDDKNEWHSKEVLLLPFHYFL